MFGKKDWKITTWDIYIEGNHFKIQFEFYSTFTHLMTAAYINGSELITKKHFMFLSWKHHFRLEGHRFLLHIHFKPKLPETDIFYNFIKVPESDLYMDGSLINPSSIYLPLKKN